MFGAKDPSAPSGGLFGIRCKSFGSNDYSDTTSAAIMDPATPTQTVNIRNATTKAVTLYPNKAQIVRAIQSISLQPGPNTVVITGLTPTCDEHSIKVDGTGSATITDLTTELVDNPEVYLEIYPDEEEDDDYNLPDVSDDESENEGRLKEVQNRLRELETEIQVSTEARLAHTTIKQACESYIRGERNYGQIATDGCQPPSFGEIMKTYDEHREMAVKEMAKASRRTGEFQGEINKLMKEERRLTLEYRRAQLKKDKEEQKRKVKEQRKKMEEKKARERLHQERVRYWPKKVYKVTISFEAPDGLTPASSRRSSVTSVSSVVKEHVRSSTPVGEATVNLTFTYITTAASWSPRYDLSLSTVTNTGLLDFSAELINTTSEAWKEAKITLSTSSSSYGGLADEIPVLLPWHLRLQGQFGSRFEDSKAALRAPYEITASAKNNNAVQQPEKPRDQLFGLPQEYIPISHTLRNQVAKKSAVKTQAFASRDAVLDSSVSRARSEGFGFAVRGYNAAAPAAAPASGGLFGSAQTTAAPTAAPHRQLASMAARKAPGPQQESIEEEEDRIDYSDSIDECSPSKERIATLLVEESVFEESGLTTTYDLPGLKTLLPRSTKSKHKITRVEFRNIGYSHVIVPKLRAAAFLKARLKNLSKITLMKGDCGLTLDGTFLGHSSIPRCECGGGFTLNFGVDPSVQVAYAKPTVRRATTGMGLTMFGGGKENNEVFTRCTTITNTKANTTLDLTLLEQVPVSEDERLKIHITEPEGLVVGGAKQWRGAPKDDPDAKDNDGGEWGSASAVAKRGGEVTYMVKINPGKGCKINLEYEVVYPGGQAVVSA